MVWVYAGLKRYSVGTCIFAVCEVAVCVPWESRANLQLVRNGTATNLVTISDDESGLPAFRVSRRGKRVAESLRRR